MLDNPGNRFNSKSLRGNVTPEALISQTAVCNRLHSVEQQLCRWLLLSHDRIDTDELIMTQELIADMLGVRREGVTVAAGHLQDIGAITYVRGRIQILDRQKLEETACECYRVVKEEFGQRVVFALSGVIAADLTSFTSLRFFRVSTLPIASFARLRTMPLFSKNTLSHARLVVCGK